MFVNIYAPNKVQDQTRFFDKLNENIEDCVLNEELRIILGEDFNVTPPTAKLKFNAHFVNDTLNWKKIIACHIVLPWIQRLANFNINY